MALVIGDLALLHVAVLRFYGDYLGLYAVAKDLCVPALAVLGRLETLTIGTLSADQLFVLSLTLDTLLLFSCPQHYHKETQP